MSDNVHWVLEVGVKDGAMEDFKGLMGDMVEATQANEPGTINYEWYLGDDGASCHIYERYADSAAAMTHIAAFGQNFAGRFMALVDPSRFTVYGPAGADVREALAGLGAAHMGQIGGFTR